MPGIFLLVPLETQQYTGCFRRNSKYFFWSLWKPNNIQGVSGGIVNIFSGLSGNPTIYGVFQEE